MKIGFAFLLLLSVIGCKPDSTEPASNLSQMLGGEGVTGFLRAEEPRLFSFPEDHGAHDGFRNEWWYLTGNLEDEKGGEWGYQLTLFRIALSPEKPEGQSRWHTRYVWMGHAAVSDIANGRHYHAQRLSREVEGLSGISESPLTVRIENWFLQSDSEQKDSSLPWRFYADGGDFSLSLRVESLKEPVLQGENGLSRKGPGQGNASYYYSQTRLQTHGDIEVGEKRFRVAGLSWLDREWSTSVLAANQLGWDWFSLQLNDGRDLMYYQIRDKDGKSDPHSAGSVVDQRGKSRPLAREAITLTPKRFWSGSSGANFPVEWSLRVEGEPQEWIVTARFDEQEMLTMVNYWEGAVLVRETRSGEVLGKGYLEMTGY